MISIWKRRIEQMTPEEREKAKQNSLRRHQPSVRVLANIYGQLGWLEMNHHPESDQVQRTRQAVDRLRDVLYKSLCRELGVEAASAVYFPQGDRHGSILSLVKPEQEDEEEA